VKTGIKYQVQSTKYKELIAKSQLLKAEFHKRIVKLAASSWSYEEYQNHQIRLFLLNL